VTRYVLTGPAARDIEEIKDYLIEEAGVRVAQYVMRDLRTALRFVGSNPNAGHVREDLTTRPVKFWLVHSYLVVYDPAPRPVEVLRVLHGARDVTEILE
jgi:plasmid stabilization system protein ParE